MRTAAGMFDVSHMGEIETTGPDAEAFLQRVLSNDVTKIAERGAQYSVLCSEDGGVLDDLFTYRLGRPLPHGHERLQPRQGPGLVSPSRRGLRRRGARRARRLGDARRAGPGRARGARPRWPRASFPRACAPPSCGSPARTALVCGTGYTGEDGVELLIPPDARRGGLGRAAGRGRQARRPGRARHAAPRGLLPPLRQRPVRGPQPDRGRPRLVLQARHRLHRRRRAARGRARPRRSCRSPSPAPASRARATRQRPSTATGVVTSGTLSPCLDTGIGMALRSASRRPSRVRRSRSTCAARPAPPRSERNRSTQRR